MTDWTNPRTWNVGELVTKAMLDTHVRDNMLYLKEQIDLALQITERQGGSASNWSTPGSTTYSPSEVKVLVGMVNVTTTEQSGLVYYNSPIVNVTFPSAFAQPPMVMTSINGASFSALSSSATTITTTGFSIVCLSLNDNITVPVAWIAIGEKP